MPNGPRSAIVIRHFATPEEVYALESFSPENPLSKETFERFLGDYDFAQPVECCVRNPNGKLCREPHKHGWVAQLKDGTSTLLGGNCATNKFGADSRIRTAMSAYRNEARRLEKLGRLAQLLQEKAEWTAQIENLLGRSNELYARIAAFLADLGDATQTRLRKMARVGSGQVLVDMVRFRPYIDEDGNPKRERTSTSTLIGVVRGLPVLVDETYRSVRTKLGNIRRAIGQAEALPESPKAATIEKLLAEIDSVGAVVMSLEDLARSEAVFWQNDWSLLWLLSHDRTEQNKAAKMHLQRMGHSHSRDAVKSWLGEQERRLKERYGADQMVIR